jgi:hypothetical protein
MLTTTWRKKALTPASLARGLPIWFNSVSISSILLLIIAKIPGMRALITASSCCSQKTIALMLHWGCKMLYNCITRREPWQRLSFHPKSIRGNCDQIFKSIIQMKTSPKSDRSSNGIRLNLMIRTIGILTRTRITCRLSSHIKEKGWRTHNAQI